MRRTVRLAAVPAAVLFLILAAAGCNDGAGDVLLPADAARLLPAAPTVVIASPGIDATARALDDLEAAAGDSLLPPDMRGDLDLAALLEKAVPGLAALVDPGRPLAVAFTAPPPMTQDLGVTLVVPLLDPEAEVPAPTDEFRSHLRQDGWLAYSSAPAVARLDTVPALATGLQPGLMSVAVDLGGLLQQYRGLIEMSLGMMAMAPAPEPGEVRPAGQMSPAQAAALAEVARGAMDSVRRLDMSLGADDGRVALRWRLGVVPGAPLSPGPQPDFGTAAALTSLLPADADFVQASAVDQTREVEFLREFYLAGVRDEMQAMPAEVAEAYLDWFEDYLDLMPRLGCPLAASADFGAEGIAMLAVLQPEDPEALAAALADQAARFSEIGLGVAFVPAGDGEAAGAAVRRWRVEIDPEAMAAFGAPDLEGPGAAQTAQVMALVEDLLPRISLATVSGRVVAGATRDDAAFAALVERAAGEPGDPGARVAAAAAAAGPDVRQVLVMDLVPVANWFMGLAAKMGEESPPLLEGEVPMAMAATMADDAYGFEVAADAAAIGAAVDAFAAMAAAQESAGD